MAQPDIVKGTYVDILMGDAAVPEVFTPICGLTTRSFTQQGNTNDVFIPDCADPEDVPVRRLVPTGRQWDLAGDGLLNLSQRDMIDDAHMVTRNYRFRIGRPAGSVVGTGYYAGPAMLTNIQWGGNTGGGEFASASVAIASDGVWAFVPPAG
jgi:hypothetical protein